MSVCLKLIVLRVKNCRKPKTQHVVATGHLSSSLDVLCGGVGGETPKPRPVDVDCVQYSVHNIYSRLGFQFAGRAHARLPHHLTVVGPVLAIGNLPEGTSHWIYDLNFCLHSMRLPWCELWVVSNEKTSTSFHVHLHRQGTTQAFVGKST